MGIRRRTLTRTLTGATALALAAAPGLVAVQDSGAAAQDAGEDLRAKPVVVEDGDTWHFRDTRTSGIADRSIRYGSADPVHVTGDWDGDGDRTPGVIRFQGDRDQDGDTDMVWYLRNDNSDGPADIIASFGEQQNIEEFDQAVVGDWDGDGTETIGVARADHDRNVWQWLLRNTNASGNADLVFEYGQPDSYGVMDPMSPRGVPVVGDWNGDGTTTVGINHKHPGDGWNRWRLRNDNSEGAAHLDYYFGRAEDRPLIGDWDGDGDETPGLYRRPNVWLLTNDHAGGPASTSFDYGSEGMIPLVWR